ncbi:MAG TPA: hypothetical protein VFY64_00760 [Nitrososphaeraceae archaeon]|nr:hypothetical protein [Nitrososphaeraceae archaeon]
MTPFLCAMKSPITIDKYQKIVASFFQLSWIEWYFNKEKTVEIY